MTLLIRALLKSIPLALSHTVSVLWTQMPEKPTSNSHSTMPLDEFLEHLNVQTDIDQPSKEVLERVAEEITEDVGGKCSTCCESVNRT
jgi:hypothetical protein